MGMKLLVDNFSRYEFSFLFFFFQSDFNGQLEFDNVHFIYPNRPEAIILKNLKLKIQAGISFIV